MYYFPCECGWKHKIDTAQAGQTIQCSCGLRLELPSMREIRQLEVVEVAPSRYLEKPSKTDAAGKRIARRKPLNTFQSILFVFGVLALIGGSATTIAALVYCAQNNLTRPNDLADPVEEFTQIDRFTPATMYDEWKKQSHAKIIPWVTPSWVTAQAVRKVWTFRAFVGGGSALLGALLITAATLASPRPTPNPQKSPGASTS